MNDNISSSQFEVITQLDEKTGDILLPIPPALLNKLGWSMDTEVEFSLDSSGDFILSRKSNE